MLFIELYARTLFLNKRMGLKLINRKTTYKLERLRRKLGESTRSLQETLDVNTLLVNKNEELEI